MKRRFVRVTVRTILVLTALFSSVSFVAADPPPTAAPGTLLVVAGTGEKGFSGDGGPATQAKLSAPWGLAFDAVGNLFIAELNNGRVRRVTPDGNINTVVGGGNTRPTLVDGIPASEARLLDADFIDIDGAGNLYLSGYYAGRVWKVSPEGLITTLRQMAGPTGVAVDAAGNLFFVDHDNDRVQKMTPEGIITRVAGGGTKPPKTADGGPATQARLMTPFDVAVDSAGNLFISDEAHYRVRRVSADGIITTVAGNGKAGYSGDGGLATQAQLTPVGIAVDSAGNLFIANRLDYRVRKEGEPRFGVSGSERQRRGPCPGPEGIISTVAGTGKAELSGVGGPAASAGLRGPVGLAVDAGRQPLHRGHGLVG